MARNSAIKRARGAARFDEWLRRGGPAGPHWRFAHFVRACDKGAIEGLGPEEFEAPRGTEVATVGPIGEARREIPSASRADAA
jgi:hypothetical protein